MNVYGEILKERSGVVQIGHQVHCQGGARGKVHRAHAEEVSIRLPRRGLQQKIRVSLGGDIGKKKLRLEEGTKAGDEQRSS